jgi:hypothetical protein
MTKTEEGCLKLTTDILMILLVSGLLYAGLLFMGFSFSYGNCLGAILVAEVISFYVKKGK